MKKFKSILIAALCFVLGASLSLAGTFAFLQDETETDYNVMTSGKVKIQQLEYERATDENGNWLTSAEADKYGYYPDKLVPFTVGKPADPAVYNDGAIKWDDRNGNQNASGEGSHQQSYGQVGASGSDQLFDSSMGNIVDHFVFVKNTGKNPAYFRTVMAVECPEGFDVDLIRFNISTSAKYRTNVDDGFYAVINGVRYFVVEAIYTEALQPGVTARPSFLQMFLDPATTNEDVELFGDTWDVLVISQAVQITGFVNDTEKLDSEYALDMAFGDLNPAKTPWTDKEVNVPYVANTAEELSELVAKGGNIVLANDIMITEKTLSSAAALKIDKEVTIDLNGQDISSLNVVFYVTKGGKLTINGEGNVIVGENNAQNAIAVYASNGGEVIINGGTFKNVGKYASLDEGFDMIYALKDGKVTINGGYFAYNENCWTLNIKDNKPGTIEVKGGTFEGWDPSNNVSEGPGTNFVAEGYVSVENNGVYTVLPIADEATFRVAMEKLDNIKLMGDITLDADNTITVAEDTAKVIDLNGYTLAGLSDVSDGNRTMIDVRGTLTVKNGTTTIKHVGTDMGWGNMVDVFYVGFNGTLNVENSTVENLGGSAMAYAIDLVNATNTTLNVTNSTIKSTYIAVRVFNNGSGMNNVTIKNSALGGIYAFWVHVYTDADNGGKGVKDSSLNFDIFNGTNTFVGTAKPETPIIYGFTNAHFVDANGNIKFVEAENASGLKNALEAGIDVKLYNDITVDGSITVADGTTLDGNGKTLKNASLRLGEGCTVVNVKFDGSAPSNNNSSSQIYAAGVSFAVKDCEFKNAQYEAIQSTPIPGNVIVIDGCTFGAYTTDTSYQVRGIHVEASYTADADGDGIPDAADTDNGIKVTITNCHLDLTQFITGKEAFANEIVLAGVFEENLTAYGNTYAEDLSVFEVVDICFVVSYRVSDGNGGWKTYYVPNEMTLLGLSKA